MPPTVGFYVYYHIVMAIQGRSTLVRFILTTAEANYEIVNWELLSIMEALRDWRHWLERANHPFQVIKDHKNLDYLKGAKRLNPTPS